MSDDCKSMKLPGLLKNHFYFIHLPFNVTNFNQLGRFEGKTDDTFIIVIHCRPGLFTNNLYMYKTIVVK